MGNVAAQNDYTGQRSYTSFNSFPTRRSSDLEEQTVTESWSAVLDYVSSFVNYSYANPFIHPQTQQASASKTISAVKRTYYLSSHDNGKCNPNVAPRTYTTSWQRNFDHTSVLS